MSPVRVVSVTCTGPRQGRRAGSAGPVPDRWVPGVVGRPGAAYPAGGMDVLHHPGRPDRQVLELAGVPGAARRDHHRGHPLRDPLVQARHPVARGIGGQAAGPGRARRALCDGVRRRRLHHQLIPADGIRDRPCMPNEHADKEQGRDQHVRRTVHVDRAAGPGVHVHGPAGPGAHVDGPAARRFHVMAE